MRVKERAARSQLPCRAAKPPKNLSSRFHGEMREKAFVARPSTALIATAIGACANAGVGCGRSETTLTHKDGGSAVAAASPSASAALAQGIPIPADQIAKVVNPGNFPVYTGPRSIPGLPAYRKR